MKKTMCGDANPDGNVALTYKGGCSSTLTLEDSYRCTGCGGRFHKDCIFKHFELEKDHDWGRKEERRRIISILLDNTNFTWIDIEGTNLISEIIKKISEGVKE